MTIYFTSDTHFGDPRILRIDQRPYASLPEHDADLIARWQEVVTADDEVWHLGDFALGPSAERTAEILSRLPGKKHLIVGNNDGPATLEQKAWASIQHYAEINVDGTRLILCHYAFRTWNGMGKGAVNLHGHSHGRLKEATRQYDVGVDVFDRRPVPLDAILSSRRR